VPTVWIDSLVDLQVGSGGANGLQTLMTGVTPEDTRLGQWTLLRTIIGVDVAHLIHDSGEGSQKVSIGIGVASQEAFAAASISDPEVATDHPTRGWVWRWQGITYGFAADQPAIFTRRIDLDIRARRKLDNGESFVTVNNVNDQGVAGTIGVIGLIRQLWLVG